MITSKTKEQIALDLGISISTLKRRIKKYQLDIPRGLVSPEVQKELYEKLGYGERWMLMAQKELKRAKMR